MRVPAGCSPVMAYVWRDPDGTLVAEIPALDYWPLLPGVQEIDGKRYAMLDRKYSSLGDPTHEVLENGEVREMKRSRWAGGRVYFNRSRRAVPWP